MRTGTGLGACCMRSPDEIALWPAAGAADRLTIGQRLRARRPGRGLKLPLANHA